MSMWTRWPVSCGGFLWRAIQRRGSDNYAFTLSLTPRLRFDRDGHYAIGLAWLASWLYVYEKGRARPRVWRRSQVEVLPHVWIYSNSWQAGIHLDWVFMRTHLRLWQWRRAT